MRQASLFDDDNEGLDARTVRRVRKTSIAVYREMEASGLLSARRWEVYKILWHHGPMTSNEIFQYARLHGNPDYRHNTNARMTELRDCGVAEELGTTACQVTGHTVILWDVTDRLPRKPDRVTGMTRRQLLEEIRMLRLKVKRLERRAGASQIKLEL
jgi:hypothetical protein